MTANGQQPQATTSDLAAYLEQRFPATWKKTDLEWLAADSEHAADLTEQAFTHALALLDLVDTMVRELRQSNVPEWLCVVVRAKLLDAREGLDVVFRCLKTGDAAGLEEHSTRLYQATMQRLDSEGL